MTKRSTVITILSLIALLGIVAYLFIPSTRKDSDTPSDNAAPMLAIHRLETLGIILRLPKGWKIEETSLRNAFSVSDENGQPIGIVVEPESYYYHNAAATRLEDYASSYRGWNLSIVVDSSEPAMIDGEPALFQMFRAGDSYIDGTLDTTSIASVSRSSPRYVVQHPESKDFIIIAGNSRKSDTLRSIVKDMRFIKR